MTHAASGKAHLASSMTKIYQRNCNDWKQGQLRFAKVPSDHHLHAGTPLSLMRMPVQQGEAQDEVETPSKPRIHTYADRSDWGQGHRRRRKDRGASWGFHHAPTALRQGEWEGAG
jgi:hypothetical protein